MKNNGEGVFTVLDPRADEIEREVYALSPRLDSIKGKKIMVLNLHGGNEVAFASIAPALKAALPECDVEYFRTEGGFGGGPLTQSDWDKIETADAAIVGHNY
jgi:creatinine amidohydrolase/Fe(II)-dependent formamide hydrolase-like protein